MTAWPEAWTGTTPGERLKHQKKSREALKKRAEKRLEDVTYLSPGYATGARFSVAGNPKLNDAYDEYIVTPNVRTEPGGKKYPWWCSCYDTDHGEARARRGCSHVEAVKLWMTMKHEEEAPIGSVDSGSEDHEDEENPAPRKLSPRDPSLTPSGWMYVPAQIREYRDEQWAAATKIVEGFQHGAHVMYADAPTGSGKTFLADLVGRLLQIPIHYVCTSKQLQAQIVGELPYAKVLMGRGNYATLNGGAEVTCDDCDGDPRENDCSYCHDMKQCPYRVAKAQALRAQLAVLNTSYWMLEANGPGAFSHSDTKTHEMATGGLLVIDECDLLEQALLGTNEFEITRGRERELKVEAPKKASRYTTINEWMKKDLNGAIAAYGKKLGDDLLGRRRARGLERLAEQAKRVSKGLEEDGEGAWVRDYGFSPLVLKPVKVDGFGDDMIWRHYGKVLMMSGTIVSVDELRDSLGQHGDYGVVRVPMMFPVENRPIYVLGAANMTSNPQKVENRAQREKDVQVEWEKMAEAVVAVARRHPGERVLVHTVSYKLADFLLRKTRGQLSSTGRKAFTYAKASERMAALDHYRQNDGAVLFASSFDRGVDLADEDCRVVVVAKVPFPYLGDAQVQARMKTKGGDAWYATQTVRSLVQMTGRGVRHMEDHCTSYILDKQFTSNVLKNNRSLLPEWWVEALDRTLTTRELLQS